MDDLQRAGEVVIRALMPLLDWLLLAAACIFAAWLFHAIQTAAQAIKMGAM